MTATELLDTLRSGETSKVQFKRELPAKDDFAKEMIAMSNSIGGTILIGIQDKTGEVIGLTDEALHTCSELAGNIATNNVIPVIYISTEVITIAAGKKVLVVHVSEGINKPYKDIKGNVYVKQGSDKRRVTDNAELMRLFQGGAHLLADEMEIYDTSADDINKKDFEAYFQKDLGYTIEEMGLTYERALRAKRIVRNGKLTLAGLLFFGMDPQIFRPAFCIKAVAFFGNDLAGTQYRDSKDIKGTIPQMFEDAMRFLTGNLHHIQAGQNFNSVGKLEVSKIALEEMLQNALLHRDYYKNAPIRLMIFDNRIEIVSPGKLPNSLTVEEVKYGNPVIRNNQLVAFGSRLMPYRGLGSGVSRSLHEQPDMDLVNDTEGEKFIVTIPRP